MFSTLIAIVRLAWWMISKDKRRRQCLKLQKAGDIEGRDKIVWENVPEWARYCAKITGTTVEIKGMENLPESACVFIANHQGIMDIPSIYGFIPKKISFVSKKEIEKVPLISDWMHFLECTFMDRKSPRNSVKAIHDAAAGVKRGYSQVIFPEGTRSKGGPHAEFKSGSFHLAFLSEAPIVPLTIDGTYKAYEEKKKITKGAHVTITIHPAIEIKGLSKEQLAEIPAKVEQICCAPLPPPRELPAKK